MMTMMESTTTIDLTETAAPQATSIEEIHIETIEERLHFGIFHYHHSFMCYIYLFPSNVCFTTLLRADHI